jgi:hypothetical protein
VTRVRVMLDRDDRPLQVDVIARKFDVPWLPGNPPLILERVFDEAATRRAMERIYPKSAQSQSGDEREFTYDVEWRLSGDSRR